MREDEAKLRQVPAYRIHQLCSLPHYEIAGTEDYARCLRFFALHLYETHMWSLGSLGDCFSISGIILLPFYKRLHIGRRNETNVVASRSELATPIVSA